MNRAEFLETLKNSLVGEVSPAVLQENLQYYEEYMITEVRKGRSEDEVTKELGSPRLIAKTIIDTHSYDRYHADAYDEAEEGYGNQAEDGTDWFHKWKTRIFFALIIIGILIVVGTLVSVFFPVLVFFGLAALLVSLFRQMK